MADYRYPPPPRRPLTPPPGYRPRERNPSFRRKRSRSRSRRRERSRSRERDYQIPKRTQEKFGWDVNQRNRNRRLMPRKPEYNVQCSQRIPKQFERIWTQEELLTRNGKRGATLSAIDADKFVTEFPHLDLFRYRRMSQRDRNLYMHNPHCRQVFATFRDPIIAKKPSRILDDRSLYIPYQRRRNEWKTTNHWGQRKLLMSEIEFLTKFNHPGRLILYAGAAPGDHTNFLSDLFPDMTFVLVDPSPFTCKETERITIIRDFFTDEIAQEFSTRDYHDQVLFISDIRSFDQTQTEEEKEYRVKVDMQMQEKWVEMIQPVACMLKFRLPYKEGETEYLSGDIYLPVWGGRTTSETRLICTKPYSKKLYNHKEYEDGLYAHNTTVRSSFHSIEQDYLDLNIGYDRCYDCASEIKIVQDYLESVKEREDLYQRFEDLVSKIDRQCSKSGRTLKSQKDLSRHVWRNANL